MAKPSPKEDEVLITTHEVSINSWDWEIKPEQTILINGPGGGVGTFAVRHFYDL